MKIQLSVLFAMFVLFTNSCMASNYEVQSLVWNSPSQNSMGSMPAGNGDIGISLWVEENGDLLFYLSKTDAWSENGRLLKLGKVRVALQPNPFVSGKSFQQELVLNDGIINIKAGEGKNAVEINCWVDANNPVVEFDFESQSAIEVICTFEPWRTAPRALDKGQEWHSAYGIGGKNQPDAIVEPDSILTNTNNNIVWFHRNERSLWKDNLSLQAIGNWTENHTDPLLYRTFGALISSDAMVKINSKSLKTEKDTKSFSLLVHPLTKQENTVEDWVKSLEAQVAKTNNVSQKIRLKKHKAWWNNFWNRSFIRVTTNSSDELEKVKMVTQGYALQRYMHACGGRGNSPIKFNGSIFTLDTKQQKGKHGGLDADYRQWGGPFWWQNTRLPYWSMLNSGDFDLMKPLFKMYRDALEIRKHATKTYFNHGGAHFPETMYFWGTYCDANYGRDRTGKQDGITDNGYIKRYWQGGLEVALMMLDYYDITQDEAFAKETLVPFTSEILTFYDEHWKRDSNGKIRFDPAQSLETYWKSLNPSPEIVGITRVVNNFLQIPEKLISKADRERWIKLRNDLPPVPIAGEAGAEKLMPGETFENKRNSENPELYAIFPYRIYGVEKADLDIALRTFNARGHKQTGGWQQNAIQAAHLGLAKDAANYVMSNFSRWNRSYRFPTMYGPNYDWIPDQTHGSVAMTALQRMILQTEGDNIYLLPAFPKNWNAEFKLHAPKNTVIEGRVVNGKIEDLKVTPKERKNDLKVLGL